MCCSEARRRNGRQSQLWGDIRSVGKTRPSTDEGLPTDLAHALEDECAVAHHVIGPSLQGQGKNGGELGGLLAVEIPGGGSVVVTAGRLRTINTGAPFDDVEVEFENAPLTEDQFCHRDQGELGALTEDRASGAEEQVFDQLLREGGASANAAAFHVVFRSDLDGLPIESMMLVEARVFGCDDRVLEIERDLAERNEFGSLVIRRVVKPGLEAALHLHRGGRWVDPPGRDKEQHGERPKKGQSEEKPFNDGAERDFPKRRLERRLGLRV
jgi:hypothetical protein